MDNRVFYGEYSLEHWIDLILKQNIILPDYQRYFVWNERKVETLINTFKKKQFVPPVTIGAFKIGNANQNLLLDGQQRLTSILLAYLGLYPDKTIYKLTQERFASEIDEEDEEDDSLDNIFEWKFNLLTEKGKNREQILSRITEGNYKNINLNIDEEFLKTTFLGFSYLVPDIANSDQIQQKYYSSVFRNINVQGQVLLPQESRASLYFLDKNLGDFFDPKFVRFIISRSGSAESKADFVRYLSLLSQYIKDGNTNKVARGYKPKMETYYEEYIYSVVGENDSSLFVDFSTIFNDRNYSERFEHLKESITSLETPTQYTSIIDLDLYLFGLIYTIVFQNKVLDITKKDLLKEKLDEKIRLFKADPSHTRAPNALKYLKSRIDSSIDIYKTFLNA
ncbi:DUF262 domain-containing protein [Flavobacterium sp.]|uniref:DUF262 domain-containing protein n=1 Tax=Flavobacterium sp. TaxID=239 RepID=UPI0037531C17